MVLGRIRKHSAYRRAKEWTKRHERAWIPLMLVVGLAVDVVQYKTLDITQQFAVMGVYVAVIAASLLVTAYPRSGDVRGLRAVSLAAPFALPLSIGALLSASLVFYWFGGAFSASWPVIVTVAVLMMSNEFLREQFMRPTVQVAVFAFALFSISTIWSSFVFNSLEPRIFVIAGVASTAFMFAFALALARVGRIAHALPQMIASIATVFVAMLGAYFLNVIPPIPLAIRDAGIYHDVTRLGGDYVLAGEDESWLASLLPGQTVHVSGDEALFAYTAVFAPADLSATIVHKWQRYDAPSRSWITESAPSYAITGGREDGYRGYSRKSHLAAGTWRVSVQTARGQTLGLIPFVVVRDE